VLLYFCVFCLIVVPLPPGKTQFAVQLNNSNNNNNNNKLISYRKSALGTECVFRFRLQNFSETLSAESYVPKRACEPTGIKTERNLAVLIEHPS
jgi:hypothetical protein